jgi:hypothetical protein
VMDTKARYPSKWLFTPLSVALSMRSSTGILRASPIDDERQPEPFDPSADYDEPADKAGTLWTHSNRGRHRSHAGMACAK